ncbi:MAG: urease [Cellvibrionaceae bacterium]|nr:urease [Cellvibrionaceae bacterium]
MLELRPNCEFCDRDLPADSELARICSYECTFCSQCVDELFNNVCPNCGGGFVSRPLRPQQAHREGVSLISQPASTDRKHSPYSRNDVEIFSATLASIPPHQR